MQNARCCQRRWSKLPWCTLNFKPCTQKEIILLCKTIVDPSIISACILWNQSLLSYHTVLHRTFWNGCVSMGSMEESSLIHLLLQYVHYKIFMSSQIFGASFILWPLGELCCDQEKESFHRQTNRKAILMPESVFWNIQCFNPCKLGKGFKPLRKLIGVRITTIIHAWRYQSIAFTLCWMLNRHDCPSCLSKHKRCWQCESNADMLWLSCMMLCWIQEVCRLWLQALEVTLQMTD